MLFRYLTPILLWFSLISLSHAQILNVESFRLDKDTSNIFLGNIGLGFSLNKQKNPTMAINGSANIVYLLKKHSIMTINNIHYTEVGTNLVGDGYTHWRINFLRHSLISIEPFAQFQFNLGRGLLLRELGGLSFRLNLIRNFEKHKDKIELGFNTGAMYEYEKWQGNVLQKEYYFPDDTTKAQTFFVKSTSNLYLKLKLHETVTWFNIIYYQARFDNFLQPRVIGDVQLQFAIGKHFTFSNNFSFMVDSAPILSDNTFIYSFGSSLGYKIR